MNYPALQRPPIVPPRPNNTKLIICIIVTVVIILVGIVVVGIALGVGLGVGLRNKSSSSSSSTTSSVLSAPVVSCTYGGASTCGCASTQPSFLSSRIVNGYTAVAHSWPWAVVIYYNNKQLCDGFLVTYQHVVTAAHCVYTYTNSISSLKVVAGAHSLSSATGVQILTVSSMQVHPSYSFTTQLNDIAVLKLSSALTTGPNVGLCCLTSDGSLPSLNEHAVIIGWGETRASDTTSVSDTLQQAVVAVQGSTSTCGVGTNSDKQFCAGYGTSDTCQGDSGGPLMTSVNNLWTCTGIVSYGIGCGSGGYYTRVSFYRTFISGAITTP